MNRKWIGTKAAALLALAPITTAITASAAPGRFEERFTAFDTAAQAEDCATVTALFPLLQKDPGFAKLSERVQGWAYSSAAWCVVTKNKDVDTGYRYTLAATERPAATKFAWWVRWGVEADRKDWKAAVTTAEVMAARAPDILNALPIRLAFNVAAGTKDDPALKRRLLRVLTAPSYQPEEVLASTDGFKRDYAAMLAADGDMAGARALVAQITSPFTMITMSVDPRLRSLLPSGFDPRAVTERRLQDYRNISASHTGSLAAVIAVSQTLRQLGKVEESLATLQAASPEGPLAASFTDLDEQRNWWWDEMARSYQVLGRYDDAVAMFRKATAQQENGSANVSQLINLAHAQLRFGHPEDTLKTVQGLEPSTYEASPYGRMELALVRGCARYALGRADGRVDLDFATAHEKDHPEATMALLLCAGDLDGAAQAAIRQLKDPDRRVAMLLQFSDWDPERPSYPATVFENGLKTLAARADVQAAIAEAGGTRRFHLRSSEL